MRQISLRNFRAIRSQLVRDNSLSKYSATLAEAVYAEIDNPDGDCHFCLGILQVMQEKGWRWSNEREDIHRLLPLHRQLERLNVPATNRNQYYRSTACVFVANTLGSDMTINDFLALCSRGEVGQHLV